MEPIILLSITVFLLFMLPLLPGLGELVSPTDVSPLRVSQAYDTNPMHFAEGFREFVRKNFSDIHSAQNQNGRLPNNTNYQLVGEKGIPNLDASTVTGKLILSAHPLTLPAGELFEAEVYSRQGIMAGERSSFRAILAEGSLMLREYGTVLRWAHSEGEMVVGRHSKLYGRATSGHSIVLGENVQFERLHAPRIVTTNPKTSPHHQPLPTQNVLRALSDVRMQSARRWLLKGHFDFPAKHMFEGDIVTGTTAYIGDHSHIVGSLKCNADDDVVYHLKSSGSTTSDNRKVACCDIGNHVRIDGSVVSSRDLTIGEFCQIKGPVIAEGLLIIGAGTVIGAPDMLTTVTAPRIIIESGCTIYGTLWASEGGVVRPAQQHSGVAA